MLDLGLDLNAWPWVWLFIAVVFALLELTLLGGSFILLPFAASAFIASILGFYDVVIEVQWAVFVIGGAILWLGFYRWARKFLDENILPPGVGANRLVGMIGVITASVDPADGARSGRVSVAGEIWPVNAAEGAPIGAGARVRVTSVEGTRVVVEEVAPEESDTT